MSMCLTTWPKAEAAVLWVEIERVRGVTSQEEIQSSIESWSCLERRGGSTFMKGAEFVQVNGRQTHRRAQMF